MAKTLNKKGQGLMFPPGTRHNGVTPSMATLTRMPLAIPAPITESKREFILALLRDAGPKGITWAAIQAALVAKYGAAPKKRSALYGVLDGLPWHKVVGKAGVVTYYVGRGKGRKKGKVAE